MKKIFISLIILLSVSIIACQPDTVDPGIPAQKIAEGTPILAISGSDTINDDTLTQEHLQDTTNIPEESTTPQPVMTADNIPIKRVKEGDLVNFPNLNAADPDGDKITYVFSKPLNDKGEWQTKRGDAGEYNIVITATDGTATARQEVTLIIESTNKPPVLVLASNTITVDEGDTILLDVRGTDPNGDKVDISFSGWMTTKEKKTTAQDIGRHTVTITATDGQVSVSETVTVTVKDVNEAPIIAPLHTITVTEGENIRVTPQVTDPDGDTVTITFGAPLNDQGLWTTGNGQEGRYTATITASDGNLETKTTVDIIVQHLNEAPVLRLKSKSITVKEGERVTIDYTVTDPEGEDVTVTFEGWMLEQSYKTTNDDAGTHSVTIKATDGTNTAKDTVTVIVTNVNRPPVFSQGSFN